jgi:ubiquinone/menaquinone biosynthesis C-methylase UbiE
MIELPKLYTDFAKYYDRLESQYRNYTKEAEWIRYLLDRKESKRLIDISCGTGKHLGEILVKATKREHVAMDVSREMIRIASQRLSPSQDVCIVAGDFLAIPFASSSFDCAICMYWSLAGLDHLQARKVFSEVARILEPSGLFIFDVENAEGINENLLNAPFIDSFFSDPETYSEVIRVNFSRKIESDLVDWHAYYLFEKDGVSELINDEMKLRFYSKSTLESFLHEAGFKILSVASSPGGGFQRDSPTLYIVGQRTG